MHIFQVEAVIFSSNTRSWRCLRKVFSTGLHRPLISESNLCDHSIIKVYKEKKKIKTHIMRLVVFLTVRALKVFTKKSSDFSNI